MKTKKILRMAILIILIAAMLYVGDLFFGNPVSYGIVKWHSQRYLKETYPHLELQIDKIYHDWKNGGGYDVSVSSPSSRDTEFRLLYNGLGELTWDDYAQYVASGQSTLSRLHEEYALLVHKAISELLQENICMPALLSIYSTENINMSELVLDADYDVSALGGRCGHITLYIQETEENLTAEKAAEYLLRIKDALEENEVGFYSLDLNMNAKTQTDYYIPLYISGITMKDLNTEDVSARLEEMRLEQLDYWNGPKEE